MTRTDRLTAHGQRLLDILQTHGGWMDRNALARVLFRSSLTEHSIRLLNNLAERELIDVRRTLTKRGKYNYEYRIKPPAANGD